MPHLTNYLWQLKKMISKPRTNMVNSVPCNGKTNIMKFHRFISFPKLTIPSCDFRKSSWINERRSPLDFWVAVGSGAGGSRTAGTTSPGTTSQRSRWTFRGISNIRPNGTFCLCHSAFWRDSGTARSERSYDFSTTSLRKEYSLCRTMNNLNLYIYYYLILSFIYQDDHIS